MLAMSQDTFVQEQYYCETCKREQHQAWLAQQRKKEEEVAEAERQKQARLAEIKKMSYAQYLQSTYCKFDN